MLTALLRKARTFHWKTLLLLVVVLLISMLAAKQLVKDYRRSVAAARESVLKTDLLRMRDALHQYFEHKGTYPSSLDSLVADGYLRKIPQDPITRSTNTWTPIRAGRDPLNPSGAPRIYDVKSGAQGTARDGSKYSDW